LLGEPLLQQYGEQDMLCNWQLDYEEEPLPRGVDSSSEPSSRSTKKRKSGLKNSSKKLKENENIQMKGVRRMTLEKGRIKEKKEKS